MAPLGEWDADVFAVVNRRADLMEALRTPREKRDLLETLDVSRSTLDRAVRELETLGLVVRDDGYRLTQTGRLVYDRFEAFRADLGDVAAAEPLLESLPPGAPMSQALLRGATVEIAGPPSPNRAVDPVDDIIAECERARGIAVAATRPDDVIAVFADRLADGASFEWVCTAEMAAYIREHHGEQVAELQDTGRFDLYRTDDTPPYGLGLVTAGDRHYTYLTMYDADHTLRGSVVNDTLEAYDWAENVYQSYLADAEPLAPL